MAFDQVLLSSSVPTNTDSVLTCWPDAPYPSQATAESLGMCWWPVFQLDPCSGKGGARPLFD